MRRWFIVYESRDGKLRRTLEIPVGSFVPKRIRHEGRYLFRTKPDPNGGGFRGRRMSIAEKDGYWGRYKAWLNSPATVAKLETGAYTLGKVKDVGG